MMSRESRESHESREKAGKAEPRRTEAGDSPKAAPKDVPEDAPGTGPETDAETGPGNPAAAGALDSQVEADAVAQLESEIVELRDRLLRALAETENVRRRAERDRKEAESFGGTRLARDLLAVYDNLERALGHADETARAHAGAVIEGVELTRRELLSAFAKHRIEMFAPEKGEKFDPHFQQAMFEAPVPGAEPGTVIEVIQSGFTIAGRLLRPALVGVARAAPEAAEDTESPGTPG